MEDGKPPGAHNRLNRVVSSGSNHGMFTPDPRGTHHQTRRKERRAGLGFALLMLLMPLTAGSALAEAARTNSLWERIVMVGASVSAGFTAAEPLGGPNTPQFRLSRYVEAALLAPHQPVRNFANTFFFLQPESLGRRQVDNAREANPTLVLGVDFLFWFCYGEGATDEERLRRFETGLKLLESLSCLLIVGDLPDASAAVNGMLRPEQVPGTNALAAANRRLREWAADRPNVVLLQLSTFMQTALSNQALTIRGHTLPEGRTRALLQDDKLHSSPLGCAVLTVAALEALQRQHPFPAGEVRWQPDEVLRLVLDSLKAGRSEGSDIPVAPAPARR
jgi:hypothetical protein